MALRQAIDTRDGARESVAAVVITHNRRTLLEECLNALYAQTRPVDEILVVDNASTDGTGELLRERFPRVSVLRLAVNAGGAGGFHQGMEAVHASGHTWSWLMDDDTIPAPTALERLLEASERAGAASHGGADAPLILASRVLWTDGHMHPMNRPWPKTKPRSQLVAASLERLLPLRAASFASLLVRRQAVERYGLPHAHYFIWNDDVEFTARVLRREIGYFVPASVVYHKTATAYTTPTSSGPRFYFDVRNRLYMLRGPSWGIAEKLLLLRHLEANIRHYLIGNRFERSAVASVVRGLRDGLRPSP